MSDHARGQLQRRSKEETRTSPFTPKLSLSLSYSLLPFFFLFFCNGSPSFSPTLSMPKIHRMKVERRRERSERRRRGGKRKIETKNLYLSKQMKRRQHGTFLSITCDINTAPLHSFSLKEKQTNDSDKEMQEMAEMHVEAHKPKMITLLCVKGRTKRKMKKRTVLTYSFFF